MPAFTFPAEAGTHLPSPEGWKAGLALGGWLVLSILFQCQTVSMSELNHIIGSDCANDKYVSAYSSIISTNLDCS